MSREEFLRGLEEALSGEVPASVIRENLNYYNSYISQEMAGGRTVDEIVEEIGEPRIVARTIIDSCEAAGETIGDGYGGYGDADDEAYQRSGYGRSTYGGQEESRTKIHYFDLGKWYWKLLLVLVVFLVVFLVFRIVGGIFSLFFRFAGPLLLVWLGWQLIKSWRK